MLNKARSFYARFERPISSISLVGGFVFDALTLKRVDMFWENLWVGGHLLIVAVFMVLVNSKKHNPGDESDPSRANFWYVNILQFFFGGLLSTFLVFYFRSADLTTSWLFIFILALAFWANESLKRQYARLTFQISLLFLSLYLFAIFILPIIMHSLSPYVFLLSGAVSLVLILIFIHIMVFWNRPKFRQSKKYIFISIGAILVMMNILYFTRIIPPLPLSLKEAGVYHSIQKSAFGNYIGSFEDIGWKKYFTLYPDTHISAGSPVYIYTAVFSPSSLNTGIVHRWQSLDPLSGKWIDRGKIDLPLFGGREDGFRTYSMKNDLSPGRWRVNIETQTGLVLGRVRFNITEDSSSPVLNYEEL